MGFPPASGGGGLTSLFATTLAAPAATIDTGAAGFATTFTTLFVYLTARSATGAVTDVILVTFNNDSGTNYDFEHVTGTGATAVAAAVAANNAITGTVEGNTGQAGTPGVLEIVIPNYGLTTFNKAGRLSVGAPDSSGSASARHAIFAWRNTAAINRIAFSLNSAANFQTGATLKVFGL